MGTTIVWLVLDCYHATMNIRQAVEARTRHMEANVIRVASLILLAVVISVIPLGSGITGDAVNLATRRGVNVPGRVGTVLVCTDTATLYRGCELNSYGLDHPQHSV